VEQKKTPWLIQVGLQSELNKLICFMGPAIWPYKKILKKVCILKIFVYICTVKNVERAPLELKQQHYGSTN